MLVIAARVRLDPAKREDAILAAKKMMAATLEEPGCSEYAFSADFDDPGVFRIFEEWQGEEALAAHFQAPHMAEFQAALAGFGIIEMDAHKYAVSDKGPIGG